MMFPGPQASCDAGEVDVEVDLFNAASIVDVLENSEPLRTSPIASSLDVLEGYEGLTDEGHANDILLVTDGQESCGGDPIAQTEDLYDQEPSVRVYPVGFGQDVDDFVLTEIAEAAHTAREGDTPYLVAENQGQLEGALTEIVAAEVLCTFTLDGEPDVPSRLYAFLGETPIPRDESGGEGFDYDRETNTVTFFGSACTTVRTTSARIRIVFGCPVR